jgi:hypothetical protein
LRGKTLFAYEKVNRETPDEMTDRAHQYQTVKQRSLLGFGVLQIGCHISQAAIMHGGNFIIGRRGAYGSTMTRQYCKRRDADLPSGRTKYHFHAGQFMLD